MEVHGLPLLVTHRVIVSCREALIGVCYALHATVSIAVSKNAHRVQSILFQKHHAVMV